MPSSADTISVPQSELLKVETISVADLRALADTGDPRLWAILDCCNSPAIQAKTEELTQSGQAVSLYLGQAATELRSIAPYLVRIDGALLRWILDTVWDEPWGIFFTTGADMETLRKHFRQFLLVQGPDGKQLYFRFYDPRVLTMFVPTCTEEQIRQIFGPVRRYWAQVSLDKIYSLSWKK